MNGDASIQKKPKRQPPQRERKQSERDSSPPKLKLLFTIVNRQRAELFAAMIQSFSANIQLYATAEGTASSEMMEYLGLSNSDKSVILSVVREDKCAEIMRFLDEKFATIKNGKGIAFTVPLSSVIGVATYRFLSDAREERT